MRQELVKWISEIAKDRKAVIYIDGNVDSAVGAAIAVEALGKEHVIGVVDANTATIEKCRQLVSALQIESLEVDMSAICSEYLMNIKTLMTFPAHKDLQARIAMSTTYYVAQCNNGFVIDTTTLSDEDICRATKWGNVGDVELFSSLTRTEVISLGASYVQDNLLPKEFIENSDTLKEELGFSYEQLDNYIRENKCKSETAKKKIDELVAKAKAQKVESPALYQDNDLIDYLGDSDIKIKLKLMLKQVKEKEKK